MIGLEVVFSESVMFLFSPCPNSLSVPDGYLKVSELVAILELYVENCYALLEMILENNFWLWKRLSAMT